MVSSENREKILSMVRQQLQRTNPPPTEALYGRAARIDESIRDLTLRQFHAGYPLQVRREMARAEKEPAAEDDHEKGRSERRLGQDSDRAALRQVFHDFAADVVSARSTAELIDLLDGGLDTYVERVIGFAAGGARTE